MFCIKCGKANRDGASFCAYCGSGMVQAPPAPAAAPPGSGMVQAPAAPAAAPPGSTMAQPPPARTAPTPLGTGRAIWIAIAVTVAVFISIALPVALGVWVASQTYRDGYVVLDGRIVVGADGEPIELTQNPEAKDVTLSQLRQFLSRDETDQIRYEDGTFVCADFAEMLHNNAEDAGIRAGYVLIEFSGDTEAHACNVFETTDRGTVYVDVTGTLDGAVSADKTVDLAVGRAYCPVSVFPEPGFEPEWDCMGRVSSFDVTW